MTDMRRPRRAARELALNILYQVDVAGLQLDDAIATAFENASIREDAKEYAETLARGAREHLADADAAISSLSAEWPPERQPVVDRNILRMAIFEIDHVPSVPPVVSVDEAVELAKKFSTEDSGKFVNGVLAAYLRLRGFSEEAKHAAGADVEPK